MNDHRSSAHRLTRAAQRRPALASLPAASWRPALALLLASAPAAALADDKPPVEVHVLEDGDDGTRDDADDADARRVEEDRLDRDAAAARSRIDGLRGRRAHGEARADRAAAAGTGSSPADEDCGPGPRFWHKPAGVHQGDVLLSFRGGPGAGGGFGGGSAEWMVGERLGLRVMGLVDGLDGDSDFHGKVSGWDFTHPAWGADFNTYGAQPHGFVALAEPNLTYHFRPGERLDVFASAGVSAFVYRLDAARGGSLLARTSIGAQWFWRALFVGAELGWYPVEIAKVEGRSENGRDVYSVRAPDEAFDGRRATFVAHVGLRL